MLKILDINRQPIAILENAYAISYTREFNSVWSASFTLPLDDPKNALCTPLNFVEITDDNTGQYIGLFRIMPAITTRDETTTEITYECKHVLITLQSDVLFRYHQTSGLTTRANLEYILDQQSVKHWRLGECEFTRYFHYKWENENGLLGALFSIPQPFDEPYMWTFDTREYPWTLNLVRPPQRPSCEIRLGKNLRGIEREIDPSGIVNRIYPLGAGEGINQLTIAGINGGKPYLENVESTAKYGLHSYVWVDRRFEIAENLKASAQAKLDEWSKPRVTYRVKAADLYMLTNSDADKYDVGEIVRIVDPDIGTVDARILTVHKPDIYGAPGNVELEIGNKGDNASTTIADLQRRQEINEVYAQGATNMLAYSYCDNADPNSPAVIRFYLPEEMVRINKVLLTYETTEFRTYGRATKGGGATTATSSSGGGTTATSSSGGGTTATSSSGGSVSKSTASGGATTTTSGTSDFVDEFILTTTPRPEGALYDVHSHRINLQWLQHTHRVSIPAHTHNFEIPAHTHTVTIPNHTHTVSIPNHTHTVSIPNHTHEIEHGIFLLDRLPSTVTIKVDGNTVPVTAINGEDVDLIPYLATDDSGMIIRGWHTVEIAPNDLGRINAQLITQFFIQSRGEVAL